jgi:hypothetical protein
LGRAQQLLDSRSEDGENVAWHLEADHVGDLAILTLVAVR